MCGIVGYVGERDAVPLCVAGLQRLEYRGYDSAGVAVRSAAGTIDVRRAVGKLDGLREALAARPVSGAPGIGHTRWATHGRPSVTNAHPHVSADGRVAVVHNGIIENYLALRSELAADGVPLHSETDSEVMAHLVALNFDGDLCEAVRQALQRLKGAYAFGVIHADCPGEIVAVRRRSPLVVGIGDGEHFIASDMPAIRPETDRVYVIDDDELARVTADGVALSDRSGRAVSKPVYQIPWPADAAGKGGHRHFMHKEIHEQPQAMYAGMAGRLTAPDVPVRLEGLGLSVDALRGVRRVLFTACGTAYHAGLVGRQLMEHVAGVPAEAELASELQARAPIPGEGTLVVAVSQSGETMDTLLALRRMRRLGAKVVAVVNVVDSTIARESDGVVYIQAGPEIGVASTKAYTLQIQTLMLFAIHVAELRGTAGPLATELKAALLGAPEQATALLARESVCRELAERYHDLAVRVWSDHGLAIDQPLAHAASDGPWSTMRRRDALRPQALYLGRGINVPSAMEGALKLKEISYLHAEAYSGGEMKHGPIALVEPAMFTVAIAVRGAVRDQMLANMMEVRARSGPIIPVVTAGDAEAAQAGGGTASGAAGVIEIPACPELLSPLLVAIPMQLFAYHIADLRGEHVDQPRNLAKTVTVE